MKENIILIDTNICINSINNPSKYLKILRENFFYVSIITEIELLGRYKISGSNKKIISEYLSQTKIINLTEQIKEKTITLRQNHKITLGDSIILATALVHDILLVTEDKKLQNMYHKLC